MMKSVFLKTFGNLSPVNVSSLSPITRTVAGLMHAGSSLAVFCGVKPRQKSCVPIDRQTGSVLIGIIPTIPTNSAAGDRVAFKKYGVGLIERVPRRNDDHPAGPCEIFLKETA